MMATLAFNELSVFKRINQLLPPEIIRKRLIRLNWLNIRNEVWRRSLNQLSPSVALI